MKFGQSTVRSTPDQAPLAYRLHTPTKTLHAQRHGQSSLIHAAVVGRAAPSGTTTLYTHPRIGFRHTTQQRNRREVWGEETVPATSLEALLDEHPRVTAVVSVRAITPALIEPRRAATPHL